MAGRLYQDIIGDDDEALRHVDKLGCPRSSGSPLVAAVAGERRIRPPRSRNPLGLD